MKPYTVVFETNGQVITITCDAIDDTYAFFACLNQLHEYSMDKTHPLKCLAFFDGKHDNRWPELEDKMVKLSREIDPNEECIVVTDKDNKPFFCKEDIN